MNNSSQEKIILDIIKENKCVIEVIDNIEKFNLPNWYIGAGCINQSVWNKLSGYEISYGIKDIDIIYFDPNTDYQSENEIIEKIKNEFSHIPLCFDIKNQARVHLWYEGVFGFPIKPYTSSEHAIDTWPTTATAIGISKSNGKYNFYAPFGFDDILNMVIRPNKVLINKEIYDKKVFRWKNIWTSLKIIDW